MTHTKGLTAIVALLLFLTTSCEKGALTEGANNGVVRVEMVNLPGTPALDIYFNDERIFTDFTGGTFNGPSSEPPVLFRSGITAKIAFTRKDKKEILFDSTITIPSEKTIDMKIVASDLFNIYAFAGTSFPVHPDSCTFRLYNALPVDIQASELDIDAELFISDPMNGYLATGIVFEHFAREQAQAATRTIAVNDASGAPLTYVLRFKNRATGEYLRDKRQQDRAVLSIEAGKYLIMRVKTQGIGARMTFATEALEI